jgi:site-specific DNA-methyltransferase (adenine-specific)
LSEYEVKGIPTDEPSAIQLWKENPYSFQDWWVTQFEVFPGEKGADKDVDGMWMYRVGKNANDVLKVAFQVKGGEHISSKDVDALRGTMAKLGCQAGVFLTIETPTKPMLETIATSANVETPTGPFPTLQLLTLKEFFDGNRLQLPMENISFPRAALRRQTTEQMEL